MAVVSLRTGKVSIVHRGGYYARYLPSCHLVYVHDGTLFAVPYDLAGLRTRGTPAPVLEDVAGAPGQGGGQFDFSQNGTFVYLTGKSALTSAPLAWMDSSGKTETLPAARPGIVTPRLSPDGHLLAVAIYRNISLYDPKRDAMTPLTFDGANYVDPVWTSDAKHIVYAQQGEGDGVIWWIRSDGSGQPQKLLQAKARLAPYSILPDGRVAFAQEDAETSLDLWTLPLDLSDPEHPKAGTPELFLREANVQVYPAFSPDGHWLAYMTTQGGIEQIFVRPYPNRPGAGKWQISTDGGTFPVWSRAARELLYVARDDRIMGVSYTVKGDSLVPDKPRVWCASPVARWGTLWNFDLAPDGKRVITFPRSAAPEAAKGPLHIAVLVNFFDELRRRVPVK